MSSWGAHLVPIGAAEHDRLTAAIQVATHAAVLAFGHCLVKLNFEITRQPSLQRLPIG